MSGQPFREDGEGKVKSPKKNKLSGCGEITKRQQQTVLIILAQYMGRRVD